jgi:hypothetical protein
MIGHKRTPQPTNSERHIAHNPPRQNSVVIPHLLLAEFLDRGLTMSTTLPIEVHGHIISSILNLVCPQCGGRMSEFQCEGRCRRSWLAEWEWANQLTKDSKSRASR